MIEQKRARLAALRMLAANANETADVRFAACIAANNIAKELKTLEVAA